MNFDLNHLNIKVGDVYFMPKKNGKNHVVSDLFGKIVRIDQGGKIYTNECLFKKSIADSKGALVEYTFDEFDNVMYGKTKVCERCFRIY